MTIDVLLQPGRVNSLSVPNDRYNPDWFVLKSLTITKGLNVSNYCDTRRAFAEGDKIEWLEVANCLDEGADIEFKRVACKFEKQGTICFYSPRNSHGKGDYLRVSKNQAKEIAKHIRKVVK